MAINLKNVPSNRNIEKKEKYRNSKYASLRSRMLSQLSAARFRCINEEMYRSTGNSIDMNETNFLVYHEGFNQQLRQWPINPLDVILKSIKKRPDLNELTIADFGCGEARLSAHLEHLTKQVISYDLVALNSRVEVCDMRNTPLVNASTDIVVYCLSLMASSLGDHFREANRILKIGGIMKIAEVESRFENFDNFMKDLTQYGFKLELKNFSHNLFYFMDFKKVADIGKSKKKKLPSINLAPCVYKKR